MLDQAKLVPAREFLVGQVGNPAAYGGLGGSLVEAEIQADAAHALALEGPVGGIACRCQQRLGIAEATAVDQVDHLRWRAAAGGYSHPWPARQTPTAAARHTGRQQQADVVCERQDPQRHFPSAGGNGCVTRAGMPVNNLFLLSPPKGINIPTGIRGGCAAHDPGFPRTAPALAAPRVPGAVPAGRTGLCTGGTTTRPGCPLPYVIGLHEAYLTPQYWAARLDNADAPILDRAQIEAQNARMRAQDSHLQDIAALPAQLDAATVRASITALSRWPARALYSDRASRSRRRCAARSKPTSAWMRSRPRWHRPTGWW